MLTSTLLKLSMTCDFFLNGAFAPMKVTKTLSFNKLIIKNYILEFYDSFYFYNHIGHFAIIQTQMERLLRLREGSCREFTTLCRENQNLLIPVSIILC